MQSKLFESSLISDRNKSKINFSDKLYKIITKVLRRVRCYFMETQKKGGFSMVKRVLKKEEVWQFVNGAAALGTGGGGAAPTYEGFSRTADPIYEAGLKPTLIDPMDIKENEVVFCNVPVGGGVPREYQELYNRRYPDDGWFKQIDRIWPLNSWSEIPKRGEEEHLKKLAEMVGKSPVGYISFELGPLDSGQLFGATRRGVPLVDGELVGYRAVPELSLTKLNIIDAPVAPYTIGTGFGDVMVGHKILSHQRWEDISRFIAVISGGSSSSAISISGENIKKGTVHGSISLAIKVGKAILEANDKGKDPVEAILNNTKGYKIFEGKVAYYTTEPRNAFNWGNIWIEGTGDYEGKTFKLFFKNENQVSWINDEPYVTCPDPFTVIDSKTGLGLSNFSSAWWTTGREVTVCAIKALDHWRTPKGLHIFCPKHFGFDIKYVPVEERIG
jgi:hypothetical protein